VKPDALRAGVTRQLVMFVVLSMTGLFHSAQAQPAIDLADWRSGDSTVDRFQFIEDSSHALTIDDVVNREDWQTPQAGVVNRGLSGSPSWIRIELINPKPGDQRVMLEYVDASVESIDLYYRLKGSGAPFERQTFVYNKPVEARPAAFYRPSFPIEVPAASTMEIYYRLFQGDYFPMHRFDSMRVWEEKAFYRAGHIEFALLMVLFCAELFMGIAALIAFVATKDRLFIYYAVFAVTAASLFSSASGVWGYLIASRHYELWMVVLQINICQITAMLFVRRFLQLAEHFPLIDKIILAVVAVDVLGVVLNLLGYPYLSRVIIDYTAYCYVLLVPLGIYAHKKGVQQALMFTCSWIVFIVGMALASLRYRGYIADTALNEWLIYFGGFVEVFLLTSVILFRVRSMQLDKQARDAEVLEELRRVDALKDQFLANTSHELRTPLHGIIGMTESILADSADRLTPDVRHNLQTMSGSARRLAGLVDDLLDFSRLKSADLSIDPRALDLRVAVDVTLLSLQSLMREKGLYWKNLVPKDFPAVLADEQRLQQILHNLLGNAVKFTDEGGITIEADQLDGHARLHIRDTGLGIAQQDQERIFTSFEQVDGAMTRARGGTGLGLSITRQLVQLLGGEIKVSSELGKGTCFSFTLPLAGADAPMASNYPGVAAPTPEYPVSESVEIEVPVLAGTHSVLVVDDEPVNQQVLQNHLRSKGFNVLIASNGQRALEILENRQDIAMVLLDIMMPRMSGYEVCERIRESRLPTELPVIMVTAKNQIEDLVAGLKMGANDYLAKPFSREELLARVSSHLNLLRINTAYGSFVPHEFLRHLGRDSIVEVSLGDNVELDMAIFISDIRGFTSLSETMTPSENFQFINSYFERVGPVIRRHDGFISRYTGDSIMALFPKSAMDALAAGFSTLRELSAYNAERASKGRTPIEIGIGLHAGPMRLGIVGEQRRRQGDIFSDTVNLASRIEGLTKEYGCRLIASEDFLARIDSHAATTRLLGKVNVRGRMKAIDIHELTEPRAEALWV
jgi:signal transduction histidine kinase/CheY-like chemotaxis protein/class 3 adenylate cyclase